MVDYHNPVTIAQEFSAYAFPSGAGTCSPINRSVFLTEKILNLWHLVDGVFMYVCLAPTALTSSLYVVTQSRASASSWEFVTTLGFEWDVIRGRRPYRWTILVCSLSGFVVVHTITEDYWFLPATDILHYARSHPSVRNPQHGWR